MHLSDIKWKADVTVIIGQNFRGLVAANEIGKVNNRFWSIRFSYVIYFEVYPVLKESVLVFSSIVHASIKVF